MSVKQKISTCLWFGGEAEEAATFYTSLFENSRITAISHYSEGMPMPAGTVLTVTFELAGTEFLGLNGGPQFPHTEASSMFVKCATQDEIDRLWAQFLDHGGKEVQCGWLKDRHGLSWQIVPEAVTAMLGSGDAEATARMMQALMGMVKLDTAQLEAAFKGG